MISEPQRTIDRALSTPSAAEGSFEQERRTRLWLRTRLLVLTGLAISLVALLAAHLIPPADASFESPLIGFRWVGNGGGHALIFLAAFGLLHVVKDGGRSVQAFAFGVVALGLVLAMYGVIAFSPLAEPHFSAALLLFLPAAFIPWRAGYQLALGVTAVVSYVFVETLIYVYLPEARGFWAERGGLEAMRNHAAWGATGTAVLAGASVLVSRTLYRLEKSAHRAKRLGSYVIHRELGGGGMGRVFLAQHSLMCRPTAVKVMKADRDRPETVLARFEREIRVSSTLTHPNTITIYDVGRTPENELYYAMEYLQGLDLQELVERFGPLSPERSVYVLTQICGSLAEAHSRNIIHRDIKPSNIFLAQRGGLYDFVKVVDFGLAKQIATDGASTITATGIVTGTPRYLAPEMVYGNERVDGRADIYCLGGVTYWMLTGRPPFLSESSVEVVIDHVKTDPQAPSEISELAIPPELDAIVLKCLAKRPADRFQTTRELQRALEVLPLESRWSQERASEWWRLHGIGDDEITRDWDCFCEEASADGERLLIAQR